MGCCALPVMCYRGGCRQEVVMDMATVETQLFALLDMAAGRASVAGVTVTFARVGELTEIKATLLMQGVEIRNDVQIDLLDPAAVKAAIDEVMDGGASDV